MRYIIVGFCITVLAFVSFVNQDNHSISGVVIDGDSNKPIADVLIKVKESGKTTTSATDGNFIIQASPGMTLLFSALGYQDIILRAGSEVDKLNVKMYISQEKQEEVIVNGYYKNQAEDMASSPFSRNISASRKVRKSAFPIRTYEREFNTEEYASISENSFRNVKDAPLSTFSIDVDAASYSNMRRFLKQGQLPPAGAVRIEEMINYFHYDYPQPKDEHPFSIHTEMADCSWSNQHKLVMIGLQGKKIPVENLPASNLVFLIDVSGSMMDENKLPLVKSSLKLLVEQLREMDRVAIVVYAGNAGLVLPSVSGWQKQKIRDAIDALEAGGSTAGGAGIQLAYKVARENFVQNGNNRIILCSDGDFNVGISSQAALEKLIEKERASGVFLTVLGYGMGNYKDNKMQQLADKGNGNHAYIDNENEAKKVLVTEFGGTLFNIAKDVKLQIEFNPAKVQAYRLVGYENRVLNNEDFNNDKKDAGDLGSGHTVTALYEIIPVGVKSSFIKNIDTLKYQYKNTPRQTVQNQEIMTIKFRYKPNDSNKSKLIEHIVDDKYIQFGNTSANFRFASAVAEFGMLLTGSSFKQEANFANVKSIASAAIASDKEGYRKEFIELINIADRLYAKQ